MTESAAARLRRIIRYWIREKRLSNATIAKRTHSTAETVRAVRKGMQQWKRAHARWARTRKKMDALILAGKLSNPEIAKRLHVDRTLVARRATVLRPPDPATLVAPDVHTLQKDGQLLVTSAWLSERLGYTRSSITAALHDARVPHHLYKRKAKFHTPVWFFSITEVWRCIPAWKRRYEGFRLATNFLPETELMQLRKELTPAHAVAFCALIHWRLQYDRWPFSRELLAVPAVSAHYRHESRIIQVLKQLEIDGWCTATWERGQRYRPHYVIHKGPVQLVTFAIVCDHCGKTTRHPHPFFQPKAQTPD